MNIESKYARVTNITLRAVTLSTRFLFVTILAKFLNPADVGYYGLFTATVGYAVLAVGMDFYTFATREIVRAPAEIRARMITSQIILAGGIYIIAIPLALAVINLLGWPSVLLWWFAPILVLEHFNQEISRILIAMKEQVSASLVLFLRQGSWAIAIVVLMVYVPGTRSLDALLPIWALSGLAAAALGIWRLKQLDMGGWRLTVDWGWVREGITISLGFLVATLALRATQTVDRYWLEALGGIDIVAAYVLYFGIASAMMVFLDAGVFAFAYPELIRLHNAGEAELSRKLVRDVFLQTLVIAASFALVSWVLLPYLLDWIGNPVYQSKIGLYPWIVTAITVSALGMVPHYALYSSDTDKPIIMSHIAGLIVFVLATWLLSTPLGALAVPVAMNISFLTILIWKTVAYLYLLSATQQPTPHHR